MSASLMSRVARRWKLATNRGQLDKRITMGRHSYGRPVLITFETEDSAAVIIGDFCSIADGVEFLPGGVHHLDWVTTFPLRRIFDIAGREHDSVPIGRPLEIGHDVYLARGVKILGARRIGHGAVVGAYSVVTRDVEPFEVVAGTPARHLRYRFDEKTRNRLLALAWWEWDDATLRSRISDIMSPQVEEFLSKYEALSEQPG